MSVVRLFFKAVFIVAEFTDTPFEVKKLLCFEFYAFRNLFRRNGNSRQDRIVGNRFELERTIPKN